MGMDRVFWIMYIYEDGSSILNSCTFATVNNVSLMWTWATIFSCKRIDPQRTKRNEKGNKLQKEEENQKMGKFPYIERALYHLCFTKASGIAIKTPFI